MIRLIPLSHVPYSARAAERAARRGYATRAAALEAARYEIVVAPGCHSRPYFDPPVIGWVCTREAAVAITERMTYMPGGTCHRRAACAQLAEAREVAS